MANPDNVDVLIEQLRHAKSEKRSSAAKRLRKLGAAAAGPALLEALNKELEDPRTWKAQFEMILAVGALKCESALPLLWELAGKDTPHTILYIALGNAILRLSSTSNSDVASIFRLTAFKDFGLLHGAFNAMHELRLVPSEEDIQRIIAIAEDPRGAIEHQGHPNDRTGVRLYVALAAAGWPRELVRPFLERCLMIPDQGLTLAATQSLKGKYTKWSSW